MSANAKMMWNFNAYSGDAFVREYAAQYLQGKKENGIGAIVEH